MDKLEKTIFELQGITNKKTFFINGSNNELLPGCDRITDSQIVMLLPGEIATEVFIQDILEYYVNTLNLELEELRKSFEDLV